MFAPVEIAISRHEEITRIPTGYEPFVGDMGSSLSGGQLQPIILAPALYRALRISPLHEVTSHFDEEKSGN